MERTRACRGHMYGRDKGMEEKGVGKGHEYGGDKGLEWTRV